MKFFSWDPGKNDWLKAHRKVSFEAAAFYIENGGLLDILGNPNPLRHPGQHVFVVQMGDYVYLVPFLEDQGAVVLKTVIPSRKMTKKYLGR